MTPDEISIALGGATAGSCCFPSGGDVVLCVRDSNIALVREGGTVTGAVIGLRVAVLTHDGAGVEEYVLPLRSATTDGR